MPKTKTTESKAEEKKTKKSVTKPKSSKAKKSDKKVKTKTGKPKAKKDKPKESPGESPKKSQIDNKEFLPVIHKGQTTHLSLSTAIKGKLVDTTDIESKYVGYTAIEVGGATYYIQPGQYQKHVLDKNEIPEEAEKIRRNVLDSLQEFKKAWVKFGTAVIAVSSTRLFFAWGYKTFKEYCENELQLHESAVYEIMKSTKFLIQERRELYDNLMADNKKALKELPSYRSIYLIIRHKKQLEEKRKFKILLDGLLEGNYTVASLDEEIRKILGKQKKALTREDILAHYQKVCDEMRELGISDDILSDALAVLEKMKAVEE